MDGVLNRRFANFCRKYAVHALACSWILGLLFGIQVGQIAFFDFSSLADTFHISTSVSLVAVLFFPVVTSILIVYTGLDWLLPAVVFMKSFSFAYVSWILICDFGSAGWVIQLLIMFSDCVSLPFLWLFWCGLLRRKQHLISISVPVAFAIIVAGILDHHLISPILSALQIS